jgi:hypothetical protein
VRELREELNSHSRTIQLLEERSATQADPRLEKLRRDARHCERQLLEALTSLRAEDPEFAKLQNAASVDVDEIRSVLDEDAMLVEYYIVRGVFHVCLLSRRELRVVALGPVDKLHALVRLLRFQFSKFRFDQDYVRSVYPQLLGRSEIAPPGMLSPVACSY